MIFKLTSKEIPPVSEVGSKAKNLIEVSQEGFNIPGGFVLSVPFFAPWMDRLKGMSDWRLFLKEPSKSNCDGLKRTILTFEFNDFQKKLLYKAVAECQGVSTFAVRSSSPSEDLVNMSFAGQYESILGVSVEGLEASIVSVFSSLFNWRVVEYKLKHGLPLLEPSMAIIVQRQLASELSGVAFSINPENNCYDEVVINSSFGLGEAIVSGLVTPDEYIVDQGTGRLIKREIVSKNNMMVLDGGRVSTVRTKGPLEASLDEVQVQEVVSLVKKCEAFYNQPVDVEWAYDEALYLLQVRPITSYFKVFPELLTPLGQRKKLYVDLLGVSQGFDSQLSVLGQDIWGLAMSLIGGDGIMPSEDGGYLINVHGKQYFDVSNILKGMGKKLGLTTVGNHEPVLKERKDFFIEEYMTKGRTKAMSDARKSMIKLAFTMMPKMIKLFLWPQKQKKLYDEMVESFIIRIKSLDKSKPFDAVIDEAFAILKEIMAFSVAYVPGQLAYMRLEKMFKKSAYKLELMSLSINIESNPTAKMGQEMFQLACDPEVIEAGDAKEFERRLKDQLYSEGFLDKYDRYMYLYGDRGFKEIDVASERVKNNSSMFFQQLKGINIKDSQMILANERKTRAYEVLEKEAIKMGKLKRFERLVNTHEQFFGLRETPKYLIVMLIGQLHDIAMAIGRGLYEEDLLTAADDIFKLHIADIALVGEGVSLKSLIDENTKYHGINKHLKKWPTTFDSRGKIYRQTQEYCEGDLVGEAISPGIVKGRARILKSPYEKELEFGDILVTHATEPAWTGIFINVSAIVLEIGGLLQHGAIIAREYGIPCVGNIREATEIIKDGDIIEVDGTTGTVRIVKEAT